METTNYAIYKRTFRGTKIVNDELIGSPTSLIDAVAISALVVHNTPNFLVGTELTDDLKNYCYVVFPMDKDGNIDLNSQLYQTECYYE